MNEKEVVGRGAGGGGGGGGGEEEEGGGGGGGGGWGGGELWGREQVNHKVHHKTQHVPSWKLLSKLFKLNVCSYT